MNHLENTKNSKSYAKPIFKCERVRKLATPLPRRVSDEDHSTGNLLIEVNEINVGVKYQRNSTPILENNLDRKLLNI